MAVWALVTGASEGLGQEFAHLAGQAGFDVIVTARQEAKLEALARDLRQRYRVEVAVIVADLAETGAADRLWREASDGREIGILVNNAGLGHNGAFADMTDWPREEASVAVNVVAATVLAKRATAAMVAAGSGRILNVASVAGYMPGPWMAVYHATKAYLLSLSEATATELAGTGVSVTALCPGGTATQFFAGASKARSSLIARMPMASARDVAAAGWSGMESGRRIVVPGLGPKLATLWPRLTPRRITAWTVGLLERPRR